MQMVLPPLDITIRPMLVSILPNWKRSIDLFYYNNEMDKIYFMEDSLDWHDN